MKNFVQNKSKIQYRLLLLIIILSTGRRLESLQPLKDPRSCAVESSAYTLLLILQGSSSSLLELARSTRWSCVYPLEESSCQFHCSNIF
jgi:hypothetical protein